jgi:acetyltransferase-like isoleucine patch superfamily enzyme
MKLLSLIYKKILFSLPEYYLFNNLKKRYFKKKNFLKRNPKIFKTGMNLQIKGNVIFEGNFSINSNVSILSSKPYLISFGENILIGPNTVIRNVNHGTTLGEIMISQEKTGGNIFIGNDVWISSNCVILPNVKISDGIVVGAGSIVTKDLNIENGIYAGVPAKFIKLRT